MFRDSLIEHCSPTLASLKVANLFRYRYNNIDELHSTIDTETSWLSLKGVSIEIIPTKDNAVLVYIFRKKLLDKILQNSDIQEFLYSYGYTDFSIDNCIHTLKEHFKNTPCPHEIGIFLGYPLLDVISFIENCGKHCECCGYWKVYHNKEDALKTFAKFSKCTNIYKRLFSDGTSIKRLTVTM